MLFRRFSMQPTTKTRALPKWRSGPWSKLTWPKHTIEQHTTELGVLVERARDQGVSEALSLRDPDDNGGGDVWGPPCRCPSWVRSSTHRKPATILDGYPPSRLSKD